MVNSFKKAKWQPCEENKFTPRFKIPFLGMWIPFSWELGIKSRKQMYSLLCAPNNFFLGNRSPDS